MRILPVIQARMGSTRLPGKMLRPIAGRSLLSWVLRAARLSGVGASVVVATSSLPEDDLLAAAAEAEGAECFRGDPQDVLSRYVAVASAFGADACVRITGDAPLQDPVLISQAASAFRHGGELDFLATFPPRRLPLGLDVEVISSAALRQLDKVASGFHRIHVTSMLYEHPELFRGKTLALSPDAASYRLTVDTAADLEAVQLIAEVLGDGPHPWEEVVALLSARPDIVAINAHVKQKKPQEG
jgi:spore coat polysaccharide biosynthesis protein SpsF